MAAPSSSGEGITHVTSLGVDGLDWTVGSQSFKVTRLDPNGRIMECIGTTKPSNGGAGFAVGCIFVHSDGTTNTALYINEGSVTSCTFNAISASAATTYIGLTDGPGSITAYAAQIGNAGGTALVAGPLFDTSHTYTAGNVLYGDGSKFVSGTADTAGLVSKAGNQTGIAGNKTFTGTVTAASLVGPVTGNVTGNVVGNLTGNSAGTHTGAVIGNVAGNLTGNVTGNVTGDVTGNLTGAITGSGAGLTANTVPPTALPKVPTDMGNATITVDFSNSNGANVTNFITDGTVTGSAFVGSGASLTVNTVSPKALPAAPTDMGDATITVDFSNSNGANVTNFVTDGSVTAGSFSGSASGLTAGSVKATALQSAAADLGAADVTINLGNTNGAFVTNITTDGTITAATFSGAISGTGAGLTANTVKPTALPKTPTDLGDATITVDISNSNGSNITNFITDGSITGGSLVTATSTTTGSLISTPVDSDFAEGNVTLAVGNKYVVTVDGAGAGSTITALTGGTAGQTVILIGICTTADVSLADGANLQMAGGTGPTLSINDTVMLACVDGTKWVEVSRSINKNS
jgi:trimeric autotransporter adhesin